MGKSSLSRTAKAFETSILEKNQSAASLNIDTNRNCINEYNWRVIEVILSDSSKNEEFNYKKPALNISKNLKHSSTTKWLNEANGFKMKSCLNTKNDSNVITNTNTIRNKLSFLTKSSNKIKQNQKDTNKKFNEIISLQKRLVQAKTESKILLNYSQENKRLKNNIKQTESVSSDEDSISIPNSNVGSIPKQKPYTSFIECAHKRKSNAPTTEGRSTMYEEISWSSPVSGWISKINKTTQNSVFPLGRNLIPVFSSNVKTIESKIKVLNLTQERNENESRNKNKALYTTGKK